MTHIISILAWPVAAVIISANARRAIGAVVLLYVSKDRNDA